MKESTPNRFCDEFLNFGLDLTAVIRETVKLAALLWMRNGLTEPSPACRRTIPHSNWKRRKKKTNFQKTMDLASGSGLVSTGFPVQTGWITERNEKGIRNGRVENGAQTEPIRTGPIKSVAGRHGQGRLQGRLHRQPPPHSASSPQATSSHPAGVYGSPRQPDGCLAEFNLSAWVRPLVLTLLSINPANYFCDCF